MAPEVEKLRVLLERSSKVLAFTGAGLSTGSGIPDFRGPAGVWQSRAPTYYQEFISDEDARRDYWEFKLEGYLAFRDARPNAAHLALVELERRGKLACLVTQNVDGLHQAAGTSAEKLIELHGTNSAVECTECRRREPTERCMLEFERTREPPTCSACGALMKPAVVMFGQSLDMTQLGSAFRHAERADLLLALGSSLVVTPAADVPLAGARRGTPYVIVNRGETPHDRLATFCIDADVVSVLAEALG
ncbi:MAG: Sir2 family NAD-dependent protein deacetylase [Myxococcales bacterium]|nr:Sir2 family NAD-dependent protein deacetylase [Myxococcales bacterium]